MYTVFTEQNIAQDIQHAGMHALPDVLIFLDMYSSLLYNPTSPGPSFDH